MEAKIVPRPITGHRDRSPSLLSSAQIRQLFRRAGAVDILASKIFPDSSYLTQSAASANRILVSAILM